MWSYSILGLYKTQYKSIFVKGQHQCKNISNARKALSGKNKLPRICETTSANSTDLQVKNVTCSPTVSVGVRK